MERLNASINGSIGNVPTSRTVSPKIARHEKPLGKEQEIDSSDHTVERFDPELVFDDQDAVLSPQQRAKRNSGSWVQRILPKRRHSSRKKWDDDDFLC